MKKIAILMTSILTVSALYADNIADYGKGDIKVNTLESVGNLNSLNQSDYNHLDTNIQNQIAQQYNLTSAEYKDYLRVKGNTSIGQYYDGKNLSPHFYLADYYLEKGDQAKANQYIKKYAKAEHDEVARLIYIQTKFQRFAQEQFPSETPIKLKGAIPNGYTTYGFQKHNSVIDQTMNFVNKGVVTDNANYVLIEDVNHKELNLAGLLTKLDQFSNAKLDIYFLGNDITDQEIINWATQYQLGQRIAEKQITINHPGKFVGALSKQMNQGLSVGMLIKDNAGEYKVLSWESVND
jgi:integrating conjugative element protein (TIGR03759 family)